MKRYEDGGEISGGLSHLKNMAERYAERTAEADSKLNKLRSDIKATGRAGMAGAKEAVGAMPLIRGANEIMSRAKIPKSYEEETGMKKGGMVRSSASKRADGCAIRGKTKGKMV